MSAPPQRSDDHPLEEAITFRLGLDSGIVRKGEVDLPAGRRCQRSQSDWGTAPQGFVRCRFRSFLKLKGASLFETVRIEVHRKTLRQTPVEHAVREVLERIETAPPGSGEEPQIASF